MTPRSPSSVAPLVFSCFLAALVFALDVLTPLGVALGVPYVAVVLVGLWLPGIRALYVLAGLGSLLTVAGYFLSEPVGEPWMVLSNRGLALFAIWVTAFVGSQRKRAEAALRRSHDEVRTILDNLTETLFRADDEGRIAMVSRSVKELLGYEPDELRGRAAADFYVDPEGRPEFLRRLNEGGGRLTGYEVALRHRDGGVVWVSTNAHYWRDGGEAIIGVEGTVRDITDRKAAEEEIGMVREELENRVEVRTRELSREIAERKSVEVTLRESEIKLRSAIDHMPSLFFHRDKEGRYTLTNEEFEKGYALKPGEAIGKTPHHFCTKEVAEVYLATDRAVIESGQTTRTEMAVTWADGIPRILRVVKYPVKSAHGDITGVGLVSTDITDFKKTEEALRESEARFRCIFEDTAVATAFGKRGGRLRMVNQAMCEMFGYSEQEMLNMSVLDIIHPDDRERSRRKISRLLEWGTNPYSAEKRYVRKDGETIWNLFSMTPVRDAEGKTVFSIRQYQDITERKRVEEALLAAKEEAELANRAKSEFLANISHELRTPLNAIIGFSELIRGETFGPLANQKYEEYVGDIHASGLHLLDVVNDILDVSAIESGLLELNEDTLDVGGIVDASLRMMRFRAEAETVKIESSVDPHLPRLVADELKVKQILLNLLSNAVKFTLEGGTVSIDARMEDDNSMAIVVSDTGIGMDPDDLALAMEKFGQVDRGLDRKHEGTGLGLPLVKGLMEAHGGSLELKSEKGVGTTATIRFPKERVADDRRPSGVA